MRDNDLEYTRARSAGAAAASTGKLQYDDCPYGEAREPILRAMWQDGFLTTKLSGATELHCRQYTKFRSSRIVQSARIADTLRDLRSSYNRSFIQSYVSVGSVLAEGSKDPVSAKREDEEMEYLPTWAVAKILTLAVFIIATLNGGSSVHRECYSSIYF